ncbi:MAG TPA: hypothetical protein VK122_11205 [Brachybacterium sp.]|nr:hypothetical protein [Brachybacterium sp.]
MLQDFFTQLTSFVSGLDPWQQVPALVPVGAIPFVESYLGSFLGTLVGIHPLIAVPAAVLGNLLATFAVTALAGGARDAVIRGRAATVPASSTPGAAVPGTATQVATVQAATSGRFRSKVAAALDKYGVPGVCLLGPLVVASQITAPTLVALGATKGRVYLWMGISILAWGMLFGLFGGALTTLAP